eukprot:4089312-Amphidinium_carterae.1
MEATLEHLVWLLYPKFAHYTFTIPAYRIVKGMLRGNGMTLQASCVLLKFSWLVLTLFGPCLPILNALIALLANIYSILLFGTDFRAHDAKETEEHGASLRPSFGFILDVQENEIEVGEHGSSLPSFGFNTVAFRQWVESEVHIARGHPAAIIRQPKGYTVLQMNSEGNQSNANAKQQPRKLKALGWPLGDRGVCVNGQVPQT